MPALRTPPPAHDAHLGFEAFVASRPDEEKWELIDGHVIMQATPNIDHQIIAGNLERLLNDGIERIGAPRIAIQNAALDLRPAIEGHAYVPDVLVLDVADIAPGRNVVRTGYAVAEIVSRSDRRFPSGQTRQKIAIKIDGYEGLATCEAILMIEQAAFDVTVATRRDGAWVRRRFTDRDARIVLPTLGLDCPLEALYARTSLVRAQGRI
jgi:Uma2 family endonuclease